MRKSKLRQKLEAIAFPKDNWDTIKETQNEYSKDYVKLNEEHEFQLYQQMPASGIRRIADSILTDLYKTHKSPFKKKENGT